MSLSLQHHLCLSVTKTETERRLVSVRRPGVTMVDDGPLFVIGVDLVGCSVPIDFACSVLLSLSTQRCYLAKKMLH